MCRDIRCLEVLYVVGTLQHGPQHEMCLGRPWQQQFCIYSVSTICGGVVDFCIAVGATSRCISAALSQGEHLFRPTGHGDSPSQPRVNIVGPGKDGHGGQLGHANLTLASGATLDP